MILEILANIWVVYFHGDAGSGENNAVTDTRQFQNLRRLYRAGRQNDLPASKCREFRSAMGKPDTLGFPGARAISIPGQQDLVDLGRCQEEQI
jgi:hypothetical protein